MDDTQKCAHVALSEFRGAYHGKAELYDGPVVEQWIQIGIEMVDDPSDSALRQAAVALGQAAERRGLRRFARLQVPTTAVAGYTADDGAVSVRAMRYWTFPEESSVAVVRLRIEVGGLP